MKLKAKRIIEKPGREEGRKMGIFVLKSFSLCVSVPPRFN
jgi:hypothetical protein